MKSIFKKVQQSTKLVLILAFAIASINMAKAQNVVASGSCGESNNLSWELTDDGTLTITGSGKMKGYLLEDLTPWQKNYASQITKIVLPNGLTRIGNFAFNTCHITSISIPNTVTQIGRSAFLDCKQLKSVVTGNSVEKIEQGAFRNCTGLSKVTLGSSGKLEDVAFRYCIALDTIVCKSETPPSFVTFSYTHSFEDIPSLDDIYIIVPCNKGTDYKASDWGSEFNATKIKEDCGSTGINKIVLEDKIIYPNQTSSSFYVDYNNFCVVKVYDVSGKEVLNQNINGKTEIDISHLSKGVYMVNLFSEAKVIIGHTKIIKE